VRPSRRSRAGRTNYSDPMAEIAQDMRALPEETRKAIRPKLREAGELVQQRARENASWSDRIPGDIKVVTSFRQNREGVTVKAGGANSPHARPYEGLTTRGNSFRHPVYGNRDVWVSQEARPFLMPAAEASADEATAMARTALDEAGTALGFD
jgi:hypothetical protein